MRGSSQIAIEPAEHTRHYQSYMNTLGRSQSGRLSPALRQCMNNSSSQTKINIAGGYINHAQLSQTTGRELPRHLSSVGFSDHGASLISQKDTVEAPQNAYATKMPRNNLRHIDSHSPIPVHQLTQQSPASMDLNTRGTSPHLYVQVDANRAHTPQSQLTALSNRNRDLATFERTWNEVIDTLEAH